MSTGTEGAGLRRAGSRTSEGAFEPPRQAPWKAERGLSAVLSRWRSDGGMRRDFVLDRQIPATSARLADLPAGVTEAMRRALARRGIERLYSHQHEAWQIICEGRDVVIATPTASGKSLCYNLPILDGLSRDPEARALYLFPTKALSRDQEEALRVLMREAGLDHGAVTYDGDTPGDARRAARERSGVLLTNPDMLHAGILPHHTSWARLFANLQYVVIDELHSYRGVFGSHLANVLRRLLRVAAFHGSSPTFVFASATIGNPREHAARMLGREVSLVDESGAPAGPRRVMIYNPPIVNAELGIRRSYIKCAVRVTADLVAAGVPTLVFGQSRNGVEVMLKYLRDRLRRDGVDEAAVQAYRGGYLPEARRRIEASLRAGDLRCVVATNALELGIDIGSLDAVVCAGYPGNVAALWQRFGRGGRRSEQSLAVLVTSSAPLDQYLASDPAYVVGAPVEHARIDPDNVEILLQHLKCAAFELPFEQGQGFGDVPAEVVEDALGFLTQHQVLHAVAGRGGRKAWHWATDAYPASHVSLRNLSWDNFVVIDLGEDRTIAEMDWRSSHTMLHEQAIYQHAGEQYQVERLDFENHKAFVRLVRPDYYTTALTHTNISVIEEEDGAAVALGAGRGLVAGHGEVLVVEKVVGYKKIKFHTHENVGYGDVHLPEMEMHTTSFWLTFPEGLVGGMEAPRPAVIDALRGLSVAMHTVAAVGLMIDPRDLGRASGDRSDPDGPPSKSEGGGDAGFDPTVFLYDHVPGGVGLAARLFDEREALLRRTRVLVEACPCAEGCPACIGPQVGVAPGEGAAGGSGSRPTRGAGGRKRLAIDVLETAGVTATH